MFSELLIRCSELGNIMTKSSGLTESEIKELEQLIQKDSKSKKRYNLEKKRDFKPEFDISKGAKTLIENKVKNLLLEIDVDFNTNETEKGTRQEDDSIKVYNAVTFNTYKKNVIRMYNEWITGECDIHDDKRSLIIDIKSSFSKATFPMMPEEGKKTLYEWQLRGYMMLYDCEYSQLAYVLVSTDDDLIPAKDDPNLHYVDDIDPFLLVTTIDYDRDLQKEELIKYKVEECRRYYNHYIDLVLKKNI